MSFSSKEKAEAYIKEKVDEGVDGLIYDIYEIPSKYKDNS